MFERAAESLPRPLYPYIELVEDVLGLPLFSDPTCENFARYDAKWVPAHMREERQAVYGQALELIAPPSADLSSPLDTDTIRKSNQDTIGELRGQLMTIDPGLETPAIRAFREAVAGVPNYQSPTNQGSPKGSRHAAQQLPSTLFPINEVKKLLKVDLGDASALARARQTPTVKVKLPGSGSSQLCTNWENVRQLIEGHALKEGVEIDWDKLPVPADDLPDDWYDRERYARELQVRSVSPHRLSNIPELSAVIGADKPIPLAQPYHVSHNKLKRLLGDRGYAFIDEYMARHGITHKYMRDPITKGYANFIRMEDGAKILEAYQAIPWATSDYMTVIHVVQRAGMRARETAYKDMSPAELAAVVAMHALRPKGRILDHVPRALGEALIGRLQAIRLPFHLIPVQALDQFVPNYTYSGIVRALDDYDGPVITTTLRVWGNRQEQVFVDWQTIRRVFPDTPLIFDQLPFGPYETDIRKILYAQSIQASYAPRLQLERFDKSLPTILPWRKRVVVPLKIVPSEYQPREVPPGLAKRQQAYAREMDHMVATALWQEATSAPIPTTDQLLRHSRPIAEILAQIPVQNRPTEEAVVDFLEQHGAQIGRTADGTACVIGVSAGLITYNFLAEAYPQQTPVAGWLNRQDMAALTGQSLEQIDQHLWRLDWKQMKQLFVPTRTISRVPPNASVALRKALNHVLWFRPPGAPDGPVLPHYNPVIVDYIKRIAVAKTEILNDIAGILGVEPDMVESHFPRPGGEQQPADPQATIYQQIAQEIVRERLSILPGSRLSIQQIALVVGKRPKEVAEAVQASPLDLQLPKNSNVMAYGGDELRQIFGLFDFEV